ncbi:MAG: hypothetical protein ABI480_06595 [Chitinophagaceae bacterium]
MSERLPYEQQLAQQWSELPLPDENMAWADMKRRLEEDDDDGIIVWWRRGCALWGLLLLLLLVIGWFFFRHEKWFVSDSKKPQTVIEKKDDTEKNKVTGDDSVHFSETSTNTNISEDDKVKYPATITNDHTASGTTTVDTLSKQKIDPSVPTGRTRLPDDIQTETLSRNPVPAKNRRIRTQKDISQATSRNNMTIGGNGNRKKTSVTTSYTKTDTITASVIKQDKSGNDSVLTDISKTIVAAPQKIDTVKAKDSLKRTVIATLPPTEKKEAKKDSTKPKFFFSAGIALQQQLPINGQKLVPYNSLGRKGSLADYIPSVYFRYTKEKKWFVQTEFHYGAPQYNKEFVYATDTKQDTVGTNTFTTQTSQKLKKTFYHQLSGTFNYYVLPQWSIGGGLLWNKFSKAVSEIQISQLNNATLNDSVLLKRIDVSDSNSSVFSKSYFQAMFETQYQWKRFTLGARYSMGLQPYIKFRLPGGDQQEKNSSVQLFLRYELWRSKNR